MALSIATCFNSCMKYTEQYCMSNIIATHLVSSTVIPCMHAYKPGSQRVPQEYRQLSLRLWATIVKSSLVDWVAGLMQLRMRWGLQTYIRTQCATYLYVKSVLSLAWGKSRSFNRVGKWRQNWRTKRFQINPHKSWIGNAIRNLATPQIGLANKVCIYSS